MLFRQTLFTKTLNSLYQSVIAFKEIRQTLLVQIDFLANSANFSHAKLSSFTVYLCTYIRTLLKVFSPGIGKEISQNGSSTSVALI